MYNRGRISYQRYRCGDTVWNQGNSAESLKIVMHGSLISWLEDKNGATETVAPGAMIGDELILVGGIRRLMTVKVASEEAELLGLGKEKWIALTREDPAVARHVDMLVIWYLAHRVSMCRCKKTTSQLFFTFCIGTSSL